jgi:hypothetical protein
MTQRKHTPSYTAEFRARGVRLFNEQRSDYRSEFKLVRTSGLNDPGDHSKAQNAADQAIAPKLGCAPDSLRGGAGVGSQNTTLVPATGPQRGEGPDQGSGA